MHTREQGNASQEHSSKNQERQVQEMATQRAVDHQEVCTWARSAGTIALQYFRRTQARRKADDSLVTQADIEIEQFLRERIAGRYPTHGILGEEQGSSSAESDYIWAIDPLDGTNAFAGGLPIWAVSIGLLHQGQPVLGVVYMPATDDLYWTEDGQALWNGLPVEVTPPRPFDTQDWLAIPSDSHLLYRLDFPGKTRSLGSTVAHMCYVAQGSTAGALLGTPYLWDIAAGMVLLEAAGGLLVTLDNQPVDVAAMLDGRSADRPLLATTPAALEAVLSHVQEIETIQDTQRNTRK